MNRKNILILASLAFAALPACNGTNTPDGGTTTSAGSTGGANNGGSTGAGNNGSTGAANNGSTGAANNGGSTGAAGTTSGGSSGGSTGAVIPPVPTLGTEIDRMGRPAINTALTDPFDTLNANDAGITEDTAKNLYNSTFGGSEGIVNPTLGSDGGFMPWIMGNLAIIDSLDGNCGNQAFAAASLDGGPPGNIQTVPPTRYATLAAVLTDDELYVDTTTDNFSGSCGFLGAELEELGELPGEAGVGASGKSCGGRQPTEDVIDVEYNALAVGLKDILASKLDIQNGAGLTKDAGSNPSNVDTAPYLGSPN